VLIEPEKFGLKKSKEWGRKASEIKNLTNVLKYSIIRIYE